MKKIWSFETGEEMYVHGSKEIQELKPAEENTLVIKRSPVALESVTTELGNLPSISRFFFLPCRKVNWCNLAIRKFPLKSLGECCPGQPALLHKSCSSGVRLWVWCGAGSALSTSMCSRNNLGNVEVFLCPQLCGGL